jgi:glucose-6-phosphate-specific signal transduction histidine kinase
MVISSVIVFLARLLFWGAMVLLTTSIGAILLAASNGWQGQVAGGLLCAVGFGSFCYLKLKSMDE